MISEDKIVIETCHNGHLNGVDEARRNVNPSSLRYVSTLLQVYSMK